MVLGNLVLCAYRPFAGCTLVFEGASATRCRSIFWSCLLGFQVLRAVWQYAAVQTWQAADPPSSPCSESMSQDTKYIHCVGSLEDLLRPCIDCGQPTGSHCKTKKQQGHLFSKGSGCLAPFRVPNEKGQPEQETPLCIPCQYDHFACRFCRAVHGCTSTAPK